MEGGTPASKEEELPGKFARSILSSAPFSPGFSSAPRPEDRFFRPLSAAVRGSFDSAWK
jgi:hypothetical protein